VKLTTHNHLVLSSKNAWNCTPLPNTSSWLGA